MRAIAIKLFCITLLSMVAWRAVATPIDINFRDPGSLNISSEPLDWGIFNFDTPYYDPLVIDLGGGLELAITATAYTNGNDDSELDDRVVYYSPIGAPLNAGLGVESVTVARGLFGVEFPNPNGRDGSIDIDSHRSIDNGHDALVFTFNQEVLLDEISLNLFGGNDEATALTLAGLDSGSQKTLACDFQPFVCDDGGTFVESIGFIGTQFELRAEDGTPSNLTDFRVGGIRIDTNPVVVPDPVPVVSVPEPSILFLLMMGMLCVVIARRFPQE